MQELEIYIHNLWDKLIRTTSDVSLLVAENKYQSKNVLYVSSKENYQKIFNVFNQKVDVKKLPENLSEVLESETQGLLYLPHPYVVPGGRFNEMYGWDSHFIILGLLNSGRDELAKNMADNQLYQIAHYGKVLNANRSYYLSRSHPPLLASSVLAIYEKNEDKKWLEHAFPLLETYFKYYRTGEKFISDIGLSRYYDESSLPAYELRGEDEKGYYALLKEMFKTGKILSQYPLSTFYDEEKDELTENFYRSDRSMRESGFDITDMFGAFSCETIFKAPVCLNSLLFKMAKDLSEIAELIGDITKSDFYMQEAARIGEAINNYLWHEEWGGYFNYDIVFKKNDNYLYATVFYPLWAGVASQKQAQELVKKASGLMTEQGLLTSLNKSGKQWDFPFSWAPLNYFEVSGLKKYGFEEESEKIRLGFMKMIEEDFKKTHTLKEKYSLEDEETNIEFGYNSNEEGFGWTNAVYLEFLKFGRNGVNE
ncbi:MAG: trehalase family glycosidase [Alphaproteobacteria bacterium]